MFFKEAVDNIPVETFGVRVSADGFAAHAGM